MRARIGLLLATMALATTVAGSASAAPDFSGSLSAASPEFTWEGSGVGLPTYGGDLDFLAEEGAPFKCGEELSGTCVDTLLELKEPGDLTVEIDSTDGQNAPGLPADPTGFFGTDPLGSYNDIDFYIYTSDSTGAFDPAAEPVSDAGSSTSADESASVPDLPAGFYLVRQRFFLGADTPYTAKATFVSDAPAAEPTPEATATPAATAEPQPTATPAQQPQQNQPQQAAPQQQPAAQQQPSSAPAAKAPAAKPASKRAACTKKAKKIKNKRKRAKALKRCKKLKR